MTIGTNPTIIAAALLCGVAVGSPPANAQNAGPTDAGRLVALLAGCGSCHDSDDGTHFAGGHVLKTPFGELAVPNITQDAETGIGAYTFEDFERVIHRGIAADGAPLYPAMPYLHYTKMTDDDVKTLWEYVRTAPPVHHEVEVNRLPFPFSLRQNMWVWRQIYFKEGRFQPDAQHDAVWNRGAYVVEALAHCGECHTPRTALGGPVSDQSLAGAPIEEWYAPNISDGPGSIIADWSQDRLEAFLKGESTENHVAIGSMHNVVEELAQVPEGDVHAIAVYLKDPPVPTASADGAEDQPSAPPDVIALGQQIFATRCATCHGADGKGAPGVAASLVGAGGVVASLPHNVIDVMLEGIAPNGDFGAMPTFRDGLTDAQIAATANYVRSSWGNDAPTNASAEMVAGLRNVTEADSKAVAAASCAPARYDRVSEDLVSKIADLAADANIDGRKIDTLVNAYYGTHTDASPTEALIDLSGIYCAKLIEGNDAPRDVAQHEYAFMLAVLQRRRSN